MIEKGWHYRVACYSPDCNEGLMAPVKKHGFDSKRSTKQILVQNGWKLGHLATVICPRCADPIAVAHVEALQENEKRKAS